MDSYLPQQISQSDCEISSNCGKKSFFTWKMLFQVVGVDGKFELNP